MKPKKSGSVDLVNLAKTSSQVSLPKFLPTPIRLKEKLALLPAYWQYTYRVQASFSIYKVGPDSFTSANKSVTFMCTKGDPRTHFNFTTFL